MDPDILKSLATLAPSGLATVRDEIVVALLADRDYWEAEAQRYRSRYPVTAEDVEAAEVTWRQARAWLLSRPGFGVPDWSIDSGDPADGLILEWAGTGDAETIYFDADSNTAIARVIRDAQPYCGNGDIAQLDILDEMAAMEVEP